MIRLASLLATIPLLFACQAGGESKSPSGNPETSPEVRALVDRTLKQMVFVEGGTFMMGDYVHEPFPGDSGPAYWSRFWDSKPAHEVTLDGFHIGQYEVTFRDFDIYSHANDLPLIKEKYIGHTKGHRQVRQPDRPAVFINWHQARAYCRWLGELTGLPFDLPTEAQWEYAARSRGRYVGFATDNGLYEKGRNFPPFERYGHPVGTYPPNPLGLYDMSANADEWVLDWYDPDYYKKSPKHNPKGPDTGTKKVVRGGSYWESPGGSTVYSRKAMAPNKQISTQGFRCVINRATPIPQAYLPDPKALEKLREKPPAKPAR